MIPRQLWQKRIFHEFEKTGFFILAYRFNRFNRKNPVSEKTEKTDRGSIPIISASINVVRWVFASGH